jgi:hypothetical protein
MGKAELQQPLINRTVMDVGGENNSCERDKSCNRYLTEKSIAACGSSYRAYMLLAYQKPL